MHAPLVLDALRGDLWLHKVRNRQTLHRHSIEGDMRKAFYVDEPWWKVAVLGRFTDLFLRACRAMEGKPIFFNRPDYWVCWPCWLLVPSAGSPGCCSGQVERGSRRLERQTVRRWMPMPEPDLEPRLDDLSLGSRAGESFQFMLEEWEGLDRLCEWWTRSVLCEPDDPPRGLCRCPRPRPAPRILLR